MPTTKGAMLHETKQEHFGWISLPESSEISIA